jgi:hypothetical protein
VIQIVEAIMPRNRFLLMVAMAAAGCSRSAAPDPTPAPTPSASVPPPAETQAQASAPAPAASSPSSDRAPAAQAEPPAPAKSAKSGSAAALKPASAHVSATNFTVDVASPGCQAGQDCVMTLKLGVGAGYHVNKEYPYKFIGAPAGGVSFLGKTDPNTFGRSTGDFVEQGEKAALLTVHYKAASTGEAHVTGKYKLSVCSADQCQIEQQPIDLSVPVL